MEISATTRPLVVRWKPPNIGEYKISCDAAVDVGGCRIGIGIAIRDHTGFVLASCSQVLKAALSPQMAETVAIYRGIIFSRECGLFSSVLESDAATVVKWINEGSHLDSPSGVILADITGLISELNGLHIKFVPRLANQVAHGLAKLAMKGNDDLFWMEDHPGCVAKFVRACLLL